MSAPQRHIKVRSLCSCQETKSVLGHLSCLHLYGMGIFTSDHKNRLTVSAFGPLLPLKGRGSDLGLTPN